MTTKLTHNVPIKNLVKSLPLEDLILIEGNNIVALRKKGHTVEVAVELTAQPPDLSAWSCWYRCPFNIFQELLEATGKPTTFQAVVELQAFVEHVACWSKEYDPLFDEDSNIHSREALAAKLGFEWW